MNIGWIGLGEIGANMALRALDVGHSIVAYDRGAGKADVAQKRATLSTDYASIAAGCEALFLCVFSDDQVREVMLDGGALAAMKPGSVVVIHTTGSPQLARELGAAAPEGVRVLDACFSGGPAETAKGDLTLMVGGDADALEAVRPVLETYASRINLLGPLGSGQTLKLLNNLLFCTNLKQASEIVNIAKEQGLDPLLAAQVISQSSGGSMAIGLMRNATPDQILAGARKYMVKDVQAAANAARDAGIDVSPFAPTLTFFS